MDKLTQIAEYIATGLTIVSLYFLSENMPIGFTIGAFSNILWLYWADQKKSGGIFITNIVLFLINLNGMGVL